ncbi:hypothetical protein LAWI1_G003076 [Lachnellula willkommii]|uniref:BTB domain-containing protein n=1 Tax=Lachnellula willkommii TaxID=215461 RepID=A0A559M9P4_9HELO|nr:hypothetical protein LAWI1_G003076 [Lachnellula willkommii]
MSETPESAGADQPQAPPIIFTRPGLVPDVSLQVFHQPFHVHSAALKLNSVFFCKFLDSPDKLASSGNSASLFKYDWVTKIDEDGTWQLVSSSAPKLSGPKEGVFTGAIDTEIRAFEILLCAMYSRSLRISSPAEFYLAVDLADYYCALPALSSALNGAFYTNPVLAEATYKQPHILIKTACKLWNAVLYRECLVQTMGPWSKPQYKEIDDESLRGIAAAAHAGLKDVLLQTQCDIIKTIDWAMTYRRDLLGHNGPAGFVAALEPLMKNDFLLYSKGGDRSGEGKYLDYFLCLEISDEDLPWNTEETDW